MSQMWDFRFQELFHLRLTTLNAFTSIAEAPSSDHLKRTFVSEHRRSLLSSFSARNRTVLPAFLRINL